MDQLEEATLESGPSLSGQKEYNLYTQLQGYDTDYK